MVSLTAIRLLTLGGVLAPSLIRFAYAAVHWSRAYWMLRKLPRLKDGTWKTWLFGSASLYDGPKRHRLILKWTEKLGQVFYMRVLWYQIVVVEDPYLAAEILHNRDLDKSPKLPYRPFRKLLSPSAHPDLVTAEGGPDDVLYKTVRKGLSPAFSPASLRQLYPELARTGNRFITALKERAASGPLDMSNACMCEALDAIGMCGFGHDLNAVDTIRTTDQNELLKIISLANKEMERQMTDPLRGMLSFLPHTRRGMAPVREFQRITRGILDELKARGEPAESDVSMGAHLMRLRDPRTGAPLEDGMLHAQISVLLWAGFDTTGNTMAWTLYLISQHPEVETKIVAELEGLGLLASRAQPSPPDISHSDLGRLPYLTAVVKESMRLFTVVGAVTGRISRDKDLVLDGGRLVVPRRTTIFTLFGPMHLISANWADASEFKPERFLEPGAEYALPRPTAGRAPHKAGATPAVEVQAPAESKEGPKRFMPFSDGRRDCIGQGFAKMNYMSNLARLLAHFSFRLNERMGGSEGVMAAERMAITLIPGKGIWMDAIPRA